MPVRPIHVPVGVAQLQDSREDPEIRQQRRRDCDVEDDGECTRGRSVLKQLDRGDTEDGRGDARHHVHPDRRAELPVEHAEVWEERTVVRGHGLDAVRAHHPDGARGHEREDEAQGHEDQEHVRRAAVDAVERDADRVDEAADRRHLARRQDDEDREDRDHVHQDAGDSAAEDRLRHVLLRVLHLLGRSVLELEPDVVEEQQRHEREEDRARRARLAPLQSPQRRA